MVEVALKALFGGLFVVVFALISEATTPKRFAGVFSAAPSVALGSLAVTLVGKGVHDVRAAAAGMAVGAIALLVYSVVAVSALRRFGALTGAAIALIPWFLVAGACAWLLP
ncbi:DUF3147 family protein [Actinoallomurus iriomotensis]|uniref:DUF3147 family protein n=1 Tax=Actinoallomurus iriomotensis TaxID=478107 RepID=A0A9W6VU90_9ACTN|nr:DUF3147 family protein [Actinoallomurus iriomotensis]GLY85328.1 hypothetical protein Airi02_032570 [Actinoallomurus iriomotensis]